MYFHNAKHQFKTLIMHWMSNKRTVLDATQFNTLKSTIRARLKVCRRHKENMKECRFKRNNRYLFIVDCSQFITDSFFYCFPENKNKSNFYIIIYMFLSIKYLCSNLFCKVEWELTLWYKLKSKTDCWITF